jgi:predicted dehydrogenase
LSSDNKKLRGPQFLTRRDFLIAAAAATSVAGVVRAQDATTASTSTTTGPLIQTGEQAEQLNVAIIGMGAQGTALMEAALHIPGIRFKAVCDIWAEYSGKRAQRYLKKYGHDAKLYEDYRELLDQETDLDAVLVATPDHMHAPHSIAALEKGLHVYCEKEMSNTIEGARSMVEAARKSGKLMQIGHQRRSNPRYLHVVDKLIGEVNLLGRIGHAQAQWNRSKSDDLGWPERYEIPQATLEKYGYENMHQFRNWRWFKKYGGGPIVDLGSHQIDIFNWVFKSGPISVMAAGGIDYYTNHEWYDNVYAIFEYQTEGGIARASYKVLTTTKHALFYETFMGDMGSVDISEIPGRGNWAWREEHAPLWDQYAEKGLLNMPNTAAPCEPADGKAVVDVRATPEAVKWTLPVELAKPPHQPHLENFFDAIRKGTPLNCPAEEGFRCAATVLKVNEAVAAAQKLHYKPQDFQA